VSALEDRLRDAYRAATQTVPPEAVPDLPALLGTPQRPPRARPRWTRVVIPVAAAAAVAALGVTASLLAGSHGVPASGGAGMPPRFYVESPEDGPLTVYNTATGAVTARIHLPEGMAFTGEVAATRDARTFVAALDSGITGQGTETGPVQHAPCSTQLYEFRLSRSGRPAPPSRLIASVPGYLFGAGELSVSADGNTIAYATLSQSCYLGRVTSEEQVVGVINVTTGQTRSWTLPPSNIIGSVTSVVLSPDGAELAFTQLTHAGRPTTSTPVPEVRMLDTSAPAGPLDQHSRVVSRSGQAVALSPDGQSLYLCDAPDNNHFDSTGTATYTVQSLVTGRSRLIGRWQTKPAPVCQAALDPSGRYLLISLPDHGSLTLGHLAVADLRTGRSVTLWPSGAQSGNFPPLAVGVAW
jgi:DNA-binding beta-propeller fold protein YncE